MIESRIQALGVLTALALASGACGAEPVVRCGAGTVLSGAECIVADAGGPLGQDGGALADGGAPDGGVPDGGSSADGGSGDGGALDGGPVDPGLPTFPGTIGTLTIAIRTDYGTNDGTDSNTLSLCLTDTRCFPLNVPDVDDFRVGEIDVYHFEGVALSRASVDRVEIRSTAGNDKWRPHCMQIQFDGEPVYCEDRLGIDFGADYTTSWRDPEGVHRRCSSCYPVQLTHGPMLGRIGPDSATVLVRTDATRRVGLRLVENGDLGQARVVEWRYPSPAQDYTTVFEVGNLQPRTRYFYYLEVDGLPASGIHSFRTAPPLGSRGAFRLAFGSCTRTDDQPIFAHILGLAPDLFFFIGDNHYGNTNDLNALRWFYRWALVVPERAAMLAVTPTLAVWDDHDFTGNNTDGTAPGKDVSLRVFQEYWANPGYGAPGVPGVFSRYRYGDVDFFLLDDRYYRGLDGTMLGAQQTAWLKAELKASNATFKVILSGSQWTADGSSDSWAAFKADRDALFDFFRDDGIEGVVLLSGDIHHSSFRKISRAVAGGYDLPELTSSPLANTNFSCWGGTEELACQDAGNFFVTMDFDTAAADPSLTAVMRDELGRPLADWTIRLSELR